ncbi:aldehyde dehydrogenase [Aliiglaciecola sp. CAU 1673]|uniref:aldehyde dehydrogenase n=1 Tax=Aliiglaciecola sp. CAU 1673 TaxID=3032595 RepID=UPI0023DC8049|nr:aldehyde dehydrogenase [Aliiglaciecola sp. CAU 1673]MDF2177053.1 aldehyde dehydrogenase [Aliiglaciecola sp. CAU 1673]
MLPTTLAQWQTYCQKLSKEGRAFIQGQYKAAQSGKTFDCINPANSEKIADIAACDQADVELAVKAARNSFETGTWRDMSPKARKQVLLRLADLMEAHKQELAALETLDMGKPISESLSVDIPGSADVVRWHGEAVDKVYDEVAPTPANVLATVTREPIGVVAAITPWNFPLWIACWKIAPALATGNSVVLKPSEKASLTAIRLAALAKEAGIPDGVFNVVPGFGHTVGKALALHKDVDSLVFTGSTRTARQLMIYAGESNMKRVWLEAGGKNPNIIFADCPDLDKAARAAASGCFYNQGEVCVAGTRLLVERSIHDAFLEKVVEAAKSFKPGNPLDPATNMGALVDTGHQASVLDYIKVGSEAGATLCLGGKAPTDTGAFVEPTIFSGVSNKMRIAQEEIFGPVMAVIPFDSEEEAIAIANDSDYGLGAGLWTGNLGRAHRVAKALRAGSVWINNYNDGDMTVPFGGFKQSGNGRDKSFHALDKYTELKTTWIELG